MEPLRSSFAFLLLYSVSSVFGEYQRVILGDPVKLSATAKCAKYEASTLVYGGDRGTTRQVAVLREGAWMPFAYYKDRVTSVNTSVHFNSTFYGDKGRYEFTCGVRERIIMIVELDVIIARHMSVTEGETFKLVCYFEGEYVEWKTNGTLVSGLNCPSGDIKYGTGSKGKVSVSPDGCKQGDFSLTMKEAQLEDGGDYFCNVQSDGKKEKGNPAAVRLTIKPKETNHTCPTLNTTQSLTGGKKMETGTIIGLAVGFVLVAGLFTGLGWILKSCHCKASPRPRNGGDSDVGTPLRSDPAQDNGFPLVNSSHERSTV